MEKLEMIRSELVKIGMEFDDVEIYSKLGIIEAYLKLSIHEGLNFEETVSLVKVFTEIFFRGVNCISEKNYNPNTL